MYFRCFVHLIVIIIFMHQIQANFEQNIPVTMTSTLHKVFVYGTLKRGEPNHHWFSKDTGTYHKFVCNAKTVDKYPLIIGTKYNIPFLLYSPGNGTHVRGEVYEVDDKVFADLDILEDHPNYYVREENEVECLDEYQKGDKIKVWVYFMKNFKPDLLKKPTYESYNNNGSHGLKYVERYLRQNGYDHKSEILNTYLQK